jgi:chemotaxis family two-component system response regulator PixH
MRRLIHDLLEENGYDVLAVGSGARALREMSLRRPDLVITDLLMPGLSGFSLRTLMLRRSDLADIPVIVLSAYWQRPSDTLDVAAVLSKPLNIDSLLEAVASVTGGPAGTSAAATTSAGQPTKRP